jgi:oligopeptide transport system permease protein
MTRLLFWRLVQLPVLLLVIYTITFALAWMIPGNPLSLQDARRPEKAIEEAMKAQYNLDDPWRFYWQYLGDATGLGMLAGRDRIFDLGHSLRYKDQRVAGIIADALPVSIQLGAAAILLALIVGVVTGVIGAVRRGGAADVLSLTLVLTGISLPTFVTGAALLTIFCIWLQWVPIGWGSFPQLILPTITLSLPFAAYIARLTRLGMIDVMSSDFIRTARAKGLAPNRVIFKHALKVAFLPVLSFLGPAAAAALTGSFVVEQVFNIPGMGQHFVAAVQNKDLFLIMGVVLVYSTILILFNLAVDIAYTFVDPRIELEN